MEQVLDIHKVLTESRDENFDHVLRLFSDPKTAQTQSMISYITSSLNCKKARHEGLLHLKVLLPQCSNELLIEKSIAWMNCCIKACQNDELPTRNLSFLVLASLLKSMSSLPELNKMVSSNNISKLIETIMEPDPTLSALICLEVCLNVYPGMCGAFKSALETFLLEFLRDDDIRKVKLSAKCFHLLPQVGGSGMRGIIHKTTWEHQYHEVIGSLHNLLDLIYTNVMEAVIKPEGEPLLRLPSMRIPQNPVVQMLELSRMFANLCQFLQVMLTEPYPVGKRVQPDLVLCLVCRGLAVTGNTLGHVSTDNRILDGFLPTIHISLLKTLDAFVHCLGDNAICYAEIICDVLYRTLQWTERDKNGVTRHQYRNIRMTAFELLIVWLKVSNLNSCIELQFEYYVMNVMTDVIPHKAMLKLNQDEKNTSKNQEGKDYDEGDEKLCLLALQCLQSMLSTSGMLLKPHAHKCLQISIANLLRELQKGELQRSVYENCDCRRELYNFLITLVLNPCSELPPPTHFAILIFSQGQMDSDIQISQKCVEMLCTVKKILYSNSKSREETDGGIGEEVMSGMRTFMDHIMRKTPDNDDQLFTESYNVEQTEVISSQNSEETVIFDLNSPSNSQKVNGSELEQIEDQVPDEILYEDEDEDAEDNSHENEFLSDDIPTKRLKTNLNENELEISLEQLDNIIETSDTIASEDIEDDSMSDNNIHINDTSIVTLETSDETREMDTSPLCSGISEDAIANSLTVDEMLSTFDGESNEVL